MSLIRGLLLITLMSFIPLCSSFEHFRCKAVPGDATSIHLQGNEFPITRVSDDVDKEKIRDDEVEKLKDETENLASENEKLQSDLTTTQKTVAELQKQNKNFERAAVSPKSCQDVKISDARKRTESGGVFDIYVKEIEKTIELSCDLETDGGGWTVFQRRMDGSEDFYRGWDDYVRGFGTIEKEFWMGLENLHQMTKNGKYELRVDMLDFYGETAYAKYGSFSIGSSADNYPLNVGSYSGTAGDELLPYNGRPFTTKDRDNDRWSSGNCAHGRKGAWWFRFCASANLNGLYHDTVGSGWDGVFWWEWKRYEYLKSTEMKFRRVE